jgi:hypothetical protein
MTEQEQAALEAEQKAKMEELAQDAEFQASLEGLSDEEKAQKTKEKLENSSDIENEIDYKAIAENEKKLRIDAEERLEKTREKARERWEIKKNEKMLNPDENEENEEKPVTVSDIQALLARQNQDFEKRLNEKQISEIAERLSSSPEEAEAIKETYRNRQFPVSLTLEQQVIEAAAIVNSKKLVGINKELARALKNKGNVNPNAVTGYQDALPGNEPEIPADEKTVLISKGFVYNTSTKRWEKKISGNKILVRDSKTKKIFVA